MPSSAPLRRAARLPRVAIVVAAALTACSGGAESDPAVPAEAPTAAAAPAIAAAPEPVSPEPAVASGIPADEAPPASAPSLPGTTFPSFGTLRVGAKAYFPNQATAERLAAGTLDQAGSTYFRGEVVSVDAAAATATVRDLQSHEYAVPLSYVVQAREPLTAVEAGQVYLGARFNRGELVMVTSATPDASGAVTTIALAGFMPDTVRAGSDPVADLVPVVDGGIGSNAVCRGPNGVRGYTILRRAPGQVLGFDGSFVRVLPEASCRFAPLRPALSAGDSIVYTYATSHREATVRAVDAASGAVTVAYQWGASEREDTARFGSIVTELPPAS